VGAQIGFDLEELEDLKTAVSEACLLVMGSAPFSVLSISIRLSHVAFAFTVAGEALNGFAEESLDPKTSQFSEILLYMAADEVDFTNGEEGHVKKTHFIKGKESV